MIQKQECQYNIIPIKRVKRSEVFDIIQKKINVHSDLDYNFLNQQEKPSFIIYFNNDCLEFWGYRCGIH